MTGLELPVLFALLVGFVLKKWVPENVVNTKFVPIVNFLIQFLTALVLQPAAAEAGIFNGAFAHTIGQIAIQAGLVTLLATGSHSTAKNTWQFFRQRALEAAQTKATEALEKAAAAVPPTSGYSK
jgi:predicted permease